MADQRPRRRNKLLDRPAGHQSYRNLGGITGISFQFGGTSTRLPPHLLQTMRGAKDGTSIASA
jgi:hypothetical protein